MQGFLGQRGDGRAEIGFDQSQFAFADRQGLEKIYLNAVFCSSHSWDTAFLAGIVPARALPFLAMMGEPRGKLAA